MDKKKKDDSFSTAKTNSSSINNPSKNDDEDDDLFSKSRPRGGNKNQLNNNFQPGRATISVPLSSFKGISSDASFKSKLLFFNEVAKNNKKNIAKNKIEKKIEKKIENDIDDIDSNININQIMESKNKNTNNDNKNTSNVNKDNNKINTGNKNKNSINNNNKKEEEEDYDFKLNIPKKNTIYVPSLQTPSLSLDYKIPGFSKIQKEEKKSTKKSGQNNPVEIKNLKSLDDQWSFQKILLDYNILDFTSKFIIINISFSDI